MTENKRCMIEIPVPLGTTVYNVVTTCGDFCLFQKNRFNDLKKADKEGFTGRCSESNPCHTQLHSIREMTLQYSNLEYVLKEWGHRVFATAEEAAEAGHKIVAANRKTMEELGFKMDASGYSVRKERD